MSFADATEARPAAAERRVLGIPFTFFSFLVVGAIAFVVNEVVLYLVYDAPVLWFLPEKDEAWNVAGVEPEARLLIASVVSVEAAIVWKFFAYEHWTFKDRLRRGN